MKTTLVLPVVLSLLIYRKTEGLELSSIIKPCNAKDPALNECVKEVGQKFIPQMVKGISDWNIPSMDPLTSPHVVFTDKNNGNNFVIEYTDVVQTGLSALIIENAEVDLAHGIMTFKLKYPYFTFTADYVGKGKLLDFNFDGQGKANISVWNGHGSLVLKYHVEKDHIKQDSLVFGFSFDKIFLDYPNLIVNGDLELGKSASSFVNENSALIIEGFKPELEKFYEEIIGKSLAAFFDSVPYSALFKNE